MDFQASAFEVEAFDPAPFAPSPSERRSEPRHEGLIDCATLTFRGVPHVVPVVNISSRGTMIESDLGMEFLEEGDYLWRTAIAVTVIAVMILLVGDPVDRYLQRRSQHAAAKERLKQSLEHEE